MNSEESKNSSPTEPVQGSGIDFSDPHSPLAPYYLRSSHVAAVFLLCLIFFFFSLMVPLWHSDFWGHLKFGEWIVKNHALPETEPFSFYSDSQQSYFHFQWATQVGYYLLFSLGEKWGADPYLAAARGADLIRLAHGLIVTLRFFFLLLALWRISGSLPLACLGIILALVFGLAPAAIQRPQALGELFFAMILWAISSEHWTWKSMVGIPLLFVLWANCHGSFLMGFVFLGIWVLGQSWEIQQTEGLRNVLKNEKIRKVLASLIVSGIAVLLLNPHFWKLPFYVLQMGRNPNIGTMEEWSPLDFTKEIGGHWGFLAMILLLLASQAVSPLSWKPTQILLFIAFALAAVYQQRLITWWMMIFPWLIVPLWKAGFHPWTERFSYESKLSFLKTLTAGMLILIAVLWSSPVQMLIGKPAPPLEKVVSYGTPLLAAVQLTPEFQRKFPLMEKALKSYPEGKFKGEIFATEILGDFLMWTAPRFPVFTYSHVHVFPRSHWENYMTVLFGQPGWSEILDRHKVNLIIVEPAIRKELAEKIRNHSDWELVVDESELAAKRDPRTRLLIALRKKPL